MKFSAVLFFPILLVAALVAALGWGSWNYSFYEDDWSFWFALQNSGITDLSLELYNTVNGRLFSHFYLCTVFSIFNEPESMFIIYHFLLLTAFVCSLAFLLQNFMSTWRNKTLSFRASLSRAAFITAFFAFFYAEEGFETWLWISSTGVYLLSLILAMTGLALIFSRQKSPVKSLPVFVLFFLTGGLSETYALMYIAVIAAAGISAYKQKLFEHEILSAGTAGIFGIAGGLYINYISQGLANRLSWLPDLNLLQALKNTAHSLAFPFLRYEYLPLKIALVLLLLVFAKRQYGMIHFSPGKFARNGLPILAFIAISFFLPCLILSDIVPARAASLGYFAGVLFLFDQLVLRNAKG